YHKSRHFFDHSYTAPTPREHFLQKFGVESKNNRLKHRDFKSNEECRAFVASLREDVEESSEVDPDADAKAEQAAADLLAELGLESLEGLSSSAPKKNNQPTSSGKKKKRGGKKKGHKSENPKIRQTVFGRWDQTVHRSIDCLAC
ncbi:hypothetical protein THAOC_13941, partial [Thalassiosira oceanica]